MSKKTCTWEYTLLHGVSKGASGTPVANIALCWDIDYTCTCRRSHHTLLLSAASSLNVTSGALSACNLRRFTKATTTSTGTFCVGGHPGEESWLHRTCISETKLQWLFIRYFLSTSDNGLILWFGHGCFNCVELRCTSIVSLIHLWLSLNVRSVRVDNTFLDRVVLLPVDIAILGAHCALLVSASHGASLWLGKVRL